MWTRVSKRASHFHIVPITPPSTSPIIHSSPRQYCIECFITIINLIGCWAGKIPITKPFLRRAILASTNGKTHSETSSFNNGCIQVRQKLCRPFKITNAEKHSYDFYHSGEEEQVKIQLPAQTVPKMLESIQLLITGTSQTSALVSLSVAQYIGVA